MVRVESRSTVLRDKEQQAGAILHGSLLGITWHWLQHRKLRRTVAGLRSLSYAIAASNRSSGTLANVVKLSAIA
jgi:hypothetical protein